MSSKRRTFHVDWDSPSHETGTVKRRPTSLNTPVSISSNTFENVEYYEVKDCAGGYGLKLLKSFDSRLLGYENVVPEFLASKRRSNEMEDPAIKDNGNGLEHPRSCATPREEDIRGKSEDAKKFKDLSSSVGSLNEERNLAGSSDEKVFLTFCNSIAKHSDEGTEKVEREFHESHKEDSTGKTETTRLKNSTNLSFELTTNDDKFRWMDSLKFNARKDFGLRLYRESFEWRSKASRVMRVAGATRKLDTTKGKSLIPKPKAKKYASNGRGLVNSSSESSGIGSPLSPLSPLKDTSTNVKDVSAGSIKNSGSKSSGFGSPDSPLSPESQKYTAFYLIEVQLEKLRNCTCEKRQAQFSQFNHTYHEMRIYECLVGSDITKNWEGLVVLA
ncbi:unnamed protein product [Heterotrigona itama]|uniref:Uncharacterized protein n=1 Tax=Heterotrigona itama TaxID=395501 RepID=A0A6V7HIC0_9HYME|nr:unnamed protein product [Heterotrigona itama]